MKILASYVKIINSAKNEYLCFFFLLFVFVSELRNVRSKKSGLDDFVGYIL